MDIRTIPHLNVFLQEVMRPSAERLRAMLYTGQGNVALLAELMQSLGAEIAAGRGDEVVVDGREQEGLRSVTVSQLYTACEFLADLMTWSQTPENEPRGTIALRLCVRPFRAD